jgi:plastocyanin
MVGGGVRVAVLVFAGLLCLSVTAASALIPAPSTASVGLHAADLPPRTGISPVNYTLYGNAVGGWGFSSASIREPGPNITVFYGDRVNLTLFGTDSAPHSWFIDYNNDLSASLGEPSSKDFNVPGNVVGNFSFDAIQPGNWTYRCGMHPTTMTGRIQILEQARPVNLTLYGDAAGGWGFSNATIREPGPSIVVLYNTNVTLTLIAHDSAPHNWFIDYNNDLTPSPGEPSSKDFNVPGNMVGTFAFVASQTGNWTYRCHIHPTTMTGTISIVGGPPIELPRTMFPLVTEIMVGALGIVLVFAAVYHFRAVRAAKRPR